MDRFIRTARPLAMLSGPLVIASEVFAIASGPSALALASTTGILAAVLALLAILTLLAGLIMQYAVQADRTRTLGVVGLLVAIVGAVMTAGSIWSAIFVVPGLAAAAPHVLETGLSTVVVGSVASYGILGIGGLLTGISTLRAGVFPRGVAITMIVGGVLCFAPVPARYAVLAIAVSILAAQTSPRRLAQAQPQVA